jgi:hypothetical protein
VPQNDDLDGSFSRSSPLWRKSQLNIPDEVLGTHRHWDRRSDTLKGVNLFQYLVANYGFCQMHTPVRGNKPWRTWIGEADPT